MNVTDFSSESLDKLCSAAAVAPRRRLHLNVHKSHDEPVQRLFNAIEVDSYIRPHRHGGTEQECLVGIRGSMNLIVFDERGNAISSIRFGESVALRGPRQSAGVEVPAGVWHTVIANLPGSVLFEVKAGPFNPAAAKELAPWAPEEGSADAQHYLASLRMAIGNLA